jgi:hypothetical protein
MMAAGKLAWWCFPFFSSLRLAWCGRAMLGAVLSAAGLMAAEQSPGP